jgi:replicative DNA helicase
MAMSVVIDTTNGANGRLRGAITPPHNLDAEQSVLGAILLSDRSLYALVIEEGLRADDFYRERHALIYEAMLALYNESEPVDVLTVTDRLRQMGKLEDVGGPAVDELTGVVPAAGHARRYAQIVRENALLRRLLKTSYEIQESVLGHDAPPRELVEQAEKAMLEVGPRRPPAGLPRDRGRPARGARQAPPAVAGGHVADGHPVGLQGPGRDHRRLPARQPDHHRRPPGDGQERARLQHRRERVGGSTAARGAVLAGDGGGRARPALRRLAGAHQGRGAAQGPRRRAALAEDPERQPAPGGGAAVGGRLERRRHARDPRQGRRLHSQCEGGLGLIIIDYLQLMRTDSRYDSRVTAVGELSRGLKILARELGVPVIALSQLSRAVETRPDKKPQLSDLRESRNLEQDSDLVMFIYRDEYYNEDSERPGEADLLIAKHRNGAVGQSHADVPEGVPEVHELRRRALRAMSERAARPAHDA